MVKIKYIEKELGENPLLFIEIFSAVVIVIEVIRWIWK